MAPAASSGTDQRLTLDDSSFEKLLAAAWVLQCLHDQLHPQVINGEAVAQPAASLRTMETASSISQETIKFEIPVAEACKPEISHSESSYTKISEPEIAMPAIQLSSMVIEAARKLDSLSAHSADDETVAELVKTQEAIESGILGLDATMKRLVSLSPKLAPELTTPEVALQELTPVEPAPPELKPIRPVPSIAEAPSVKPSSVSQKPLNNPDSAAQPSSFNLGIALDGFGTALSMNTSTLGAKSTRALRFAAAATSRRFQTNLKRTQDALAGYRLAFRDRTGKKLAAHASSFNLGTTVNRLSGAAIRHASNFHINFTLRSLRALAIATPVWLLVVIANLLLLETWLHQPFQGGQAMSAPSPSTAEAAVTVNAPVTTGSNQFSSQPAKRIEQTVPQRTAPIPLRATHEEITDPGTQSIVQQLSRYEINGLRRQAKYGDDSAAFTLGMAYEIGRHVRQSCAEAARWVRMAAEAGNSAAQYNLGLRYRDGDGVTADLHESEKWLRKAAAHRNREARIALQLLASR